MSNLSTYFYLLLLLAFISLIAQNEIELRTDGIVVPRIDTNTLVSPSLGQMIYNDNSTQHILTILDKRF